MQQTSPQYQAAMAALTRPLIHAEITFRQVTVGANEQAKLSVTSQESYSRLAQLLGNEATQTPYSSPELNRWYLDGSLQLLPDQDSRVVRSGWWSEELSGVDGYFETPQRLVVTFSLPISSLAFSFVTDPVVGSYPVEFSLTTYNEGQQLQRFEKRGNTTNQIMIGEDMDDFDRLVLQIDRWSMPYWRVRIAQIAFGIIWHWSNDDIIQMTVLRQFDPTGRELAADEISFSIQNIDKLYNPLRPSGMYKYLQHRQEVEVRGGLDIGGGIVEKVALGTYYLNAWPAKRGQALFRAQGLISRLDITVPAAWWEESTLAEIALNALRRAGLTAGSYILDAGLSRITVTSLALEQSAREIIRKVAQAAAMAVWLDGDGILHIGPLPQAASGQRIGYDRAPHPEIDLDEPIQTVQISYFNFYPFFMSETIAGIYVRIEQDATFSIDYNPALSVWVEVEENATLQSADIGLTSAQLHITTERNTSVNVSVTGRTIQQNTMVYSYDTGIIPGEIFAVKDNEFITSAEQAETVARYLAQQLRLRPRITSNWRQDPALEPGDQVEMDTPYGSTPALILEQYLEFFPGLRGHTVAKQWEE